MEDQAVAGSPRGASAVRVTKDNTLPSPEPFVHFDSQPIPALIRLQERSRLLAILAALFGLLLALSPPALSEEPNSEASAEDSGENGFDDLELPFGQIKAGDAWNFLTDNLRWAVDFAGRINATDNSGYTNQEFFGLDMHKVVSSSNRDIGTMLVQLYVDYHSDPPPGRSNWDFKTRLLFFNYYVSGRGGLNVRLGHILVPYGLNLPSRTPGTLRQFDTAANLGLKVDWGTSVNGVLSKFNYEIALTRGSGMDYESENDPYLISGRVGTPSHLPLAMGISGLHGKILKNGRIIPRTRIGLDWRWMGGPVDVLAEISIGRDSHDKDIVNSFIDVSWRSPMESLLIYAQGNIMMNRKTTDRYKAWEKTSYLTLGSQLALGTHYWLSADYRHEITDTGKPDRVRVQIRYRFF